MKNYESADVAGRQTILAVDDSPGNLGRRRVSSTTSSGAWNLPRTTAHSRSRRECRRSYRLAIDRRP
jgi:hypothetical protein